MTRNSRWKRMSKQLVQMGAEGQKAPRGTTTRNNNGANRLPYRFGLHEKKVSEILSKSMVIK